MEQLKERQGSVTDSPATEPPKTEPVTDPSVDTSESTETTISSTTPEGATNTKRLLRTYTLAILTTNVYHTTVLPVHCVF